MRVTFDTSRAPFTTDGGKMANDPTNGRITKIEWASSRKGGFDGPYDTVLFDVNRADPWSVPGSDRSYLTLYGVTASYYVASFADSVGVTLKDANGHYRPLAKNIIHRGDGSEVKDYEALAEFVRGQAMANGGMLPSRYDASSNEGKVPRRMPCVGPGCPQ